MFGNRGFSPYGLGTVAKSGINWSSLLSNTQKTLGIINQAIPAFYQIKPIFSNIKTMFKVVNEFNKDDNKNISNNSNQQYTNNTNINANNYSNSNTYDTQEKANTSYEGGPSFFV